MIGVLLAAGFSRRFGDTDKLLQVLPNGQTIAFASAEKLIQVLPNSIAVIRQENHALEQLLASLGFYIIKCDERDVEMADSLTKAVRYILKLNKPENIMIALADMPFIQSSTLQSIAEASQQHAGIVVPTYSGQRGHPVAFSASFGEELSTLKGDQGARAVIQRYAHTVKFLTTEDAGILRDIDTPDDLV